MINVCFHALDKLEAIENSLLKAKHVLLSPSSSIEKSFHRLRQKARLVAKFIDVPADKFKELDVWLKYFIEKHVDFSRHFKCTKIGIKYAAKYKNIQSADNGNHGKDLVSYIF